MSVPSFSRGLYWVQEIPEPRKHPSPALPRGYWPARPILPLLQNPPSKRLYPQLCEPETEVPRVTSNLRHKMVKAFRVQMFIDILHLKFFAFHFLPKRLAWTTV